MICKCEEGTWGSENKNPICKNPVYTEGVLCLNCAHDKDCHGPLVCTNRDPVSTIKASIQERK